MSTHRDPRSHTANASFAAAPGRSATRKIDTRELLGGDRELVIVHAGREYRLRVTSNGKLILTA